MDVKPRPGLPEACLPPAQTHLVNQANPGQAFYHLFEQISGYTTSSTYWGMSALGFLSLNPSPAQILDSGPTRILNQIQSKAG